MVEIKLTGFKELEQALKQFPGRVKTNILSSAVNAGAKEIQRAAKTLVPIDTGRLKRNIIKFKSKSESKGDSVVYKIGVRTEGDRGDKRNAFYYYFLERGTSQKAARPFLRPALDQGADKAINAMREKLTGRIEQEAAKLKK